MSQGEETDWFVEKHGKNIRVHTILHASCNTLKLDINDEHLWVSRFRHEYLQDLNVVCIEVCCADW